VHSNVLVDLVRIATGSLTTYLCCLVKSEFLGFVALILAFVVVVIQASRPRPPPARARPPVYVREIIPRRSMIFSLASLARQEHQLVAT
jgi:hypothetical protein